MRHLDVRTALRPIEILRGDRPVFVAVETGKPGIRARKLLACDSALGRIDAAVLGEPFPGIAALGRAKPTLAWPHPRAAWERPPATLCVAAPEHPQQPGIAAVPIRLLALLFGLS